MRFDAPLIPARLLKRYKRFLTDVELANGETLTAVCPNTGSLMGCATPGSPVWLSHSNAPNRKYAHTWELVEVIPHTIVDIWVLMPTIVCGHQHPDVQSSGC